MQTLYLILSVIVLSLTLMLTRIDWLKYLTGIEDDTDEYDLLIAVLSRRENYEERMAMRNTWLSTSTELRVKHLFVVGQHSCPIHTSDRTSLHNCQPLAFNRTPNDDIHYSTSAAAGGQLIAGPTYTTLRFQVHHQVLLSKLGISTSKLVQISKRTTVTLADATRQVEVATAEFSTVTNFVVVDGFGYRPVEAIILPKGFEGVLYIEEENGTNCNGLSEERRVMDDAGGIITFDMVEDVHGVVKKLSHDVIVSVSMAFSIYEVDALSEHLKGRESRERTWLDTVEQTERRLTHEMFKYNDIQLVNVVDVYRHLPHKLLTFIETAVDKFRFRFLLKTDDDTFVHLSKLSQHLRGLIDAQSVHGLWLGRFRCNWMVERWGKWKEEVYPSAVYPCFACGSASLLSRDLVQWLANTAQHLHPFQGEDVSLGIWLSVLAPNLTQDLRWQCEDGCESNSVSRGQLSLTQMRHTWKCLITTQQLCC